MASSHGISKNMFQIIGAMSALAMLLAASGCDMIPQAPTVDPLQTSCTSGQAQIRVSDGFFQILCGCNGAGETAGKFFYVPSTLTCTVPVGTVVFFHYIATQEPHQIVSTAGVPFASSQPSNPAESNPVMEFTAQFQTAGTAYFEDAYVTGLQGQIIITP
jgi:hypothetical protein